jgi:cytochrome P450
MTSVTPIAPAETRGDQVLSAEFFDDPYPFYHRLRRDDPVHWSEPLGAWLVTRYHDVAAGLRDTRLSSQRLERYFGMLPPADHDELRRLRRFYEIWPLFADPPDHTRIRAAAGRAMAPPVLVALAADLRDLADDLIARGSARHEMDLVRDFAAPLALRAVMRLVGVDLGDYARIEQWSRDIVAFIGTGRPRADLGRSAQAGLDELSAYLRGILTRCERDPSSDGLVGLLVAASDANGALTEEEVLAVCGNLLVDGHEPIANLIGTGMLTLLRHPDQLQRLRAEPALLRPAIEEMLRYEPPFQISVRRAREPMFLGERGLGANDRVLLVLAAANRDPDVFTAPDHFDVGRESRHHHAFGLGPHFCLGAALGRLASEIAIAALLRHLPGLTLVPGPLRWHRSFFRGVESLPVRW